MSETEESKKERVCCNCQKQLGIGTGGVLAPDPKDPKKAAFWCNKCRKEARAATT